MEKEIYLAGGCFWGLEKYLALIQGVKSTEVGYANGYTLCPTYRQVCNENTGHAETVKVTYSSKVVGLGHLLRLFFDAIDPTAVDRQGNDVGTQYRSGIYYTDEADLPIIEREMQALQQRLPGKLVATEVKPLNNYCTAEEYHQKYLDKNPGGYCHIGAGAFEHAARAVPEKE